MDHRWILILFVINWATCAHSSSFHPHQQQHNCQLDNSCKGPESNLPPPPIQQQQEHAQQPPVRVEVMPTPGSPIQQQQPSISVDPNINSNESGAETSVNQEAPSENVNTLPLEQVRLPEPVKEPPSVPQPSKTREDEDGPFSVNVETLYSEPGDYSLPQGSSEVIEPVTNGAEETLVNETKEKGLEEPEETPQAVQTEETVSIASEIPAEPVVNPDSTGNQPSENSPTTTLPEGMEENESESDWSLESNETDAFDADPSESESSKLSRELPETLEPAQVPQPQPTYNYQQYTADSSEATPQLSSDSTQTLFQGAEDTPESDNTLPPLEIHTNNESDHEEVSTIPQSSLPVEETDLPSLSSAEETPQEDSKPYVIEESQPEVPESTSPLPPPLETYTNNESNPEKVSSITQSSITGEETELPSLSSAEETPTSDPMPQLLEEGVPESTSPLPPLEKPSPPLENHFYSTFLHPTHQEVHPQVPPAPETPQESPQLEENHPPPSEDVQEPYPTLEEDSKQDSESSILFVIKYLSSTLLALLPEHLQDSILDVDDALVFTGIIALTLVSICVPYYFIEGWLAVRPLKKKVVELHKSLWKVSAAYENQLEEFDEFKTKAYAYDENLKRIEVLSMELGILKKLEGKQKETIRNLQKELRNSAKVASEIEGLVSCTMSERDKANEERDKLLAAFVSMQESYRSSTEELETLRKTHATLTMDHELERHSSENYKCKSLSLEKELEELRAKLLGEVDARRRAEGDLELVNDDKQLIQERLDDLKIILGQYEETVSRISSELTLKERELEALKETLDEDSPFIDIADQKARLTSAEEEVNSLKSRVQSLTIEKNSIAKEARESSNSLFTLKEEKDKAENRLQVLEAWFKQKEDELRAMVEKYEAEKNIRGKDKEDLIEMIEGQREEIGELKGTIERLKEEFEETKGVHKSEIRAIEVKGHDNWLSLCQAERKAQDARKEAEFFRQKLLALTKEKEGEGGDGMGMNGDFMYSSPLLPPDMIPPPMDENEIPLPSYFGLSDDFMPPPPLPLGMSRHEESSSRPAPLGRISPNYSDLGDDPSLSPIRREDRGRGRGDYSDPEYSHSSRSGSPDGHLLEDSRDHWLADHPNENGNGGVPPQSNNNNNNNRSSGRRRKTPKNSSPIPHGVNL